MDALTKNVSNYVKERGISVSQMARQTGIPYGALYDSLLHGERDRELSLIEKYNLDKYDEEVIEVVEKDKVEVFGKVVTMKLIRKDGRVYPDIREFCAAVGLEIDNKGRMPVVKAKG